MNPEENKNIGDIMTNYEAELMIEVLKVFPIEEYGSKSYFLFLFCFWIFECNVIVSWNRQDETV